MIRQETRDCYLDDDGIEAVAVEAADSLGHRQSLHIRAGAVFYGSTQATEPGVWIEYQEEHGKCLPAGPVLLTPQVWAELTRAVNRQLRRRIGWRHQIVKRKKKADAGHDDARLVRGDP